MRQSLQTPSVCIMPISSWFIHVTVQHEDAGIVEEARADDGAAAFGRPRYDHRVLPHPIGCGWPPTSMTWNGLLWLCSLAMIRLRAKCPGAYALTAFGKWALTIEVATQLKHSFL